MQDHLYAQSPGVYEIPGDCRRAAAFAQNGGEPDGHRPGKAPRGAETVYYGEIVCGAGFGRVDILLFTVTMIIYRRFGGLGSVGCYENRRVEDSI